jgi:hypothetical protein
VESNDGKKIFPSLSAHAVIRVARIADRKSGATLRRRQPTRPVFAVACRDRSGTARPAHHRCSAEGGSRPSRFPVPGQYYGRDRHPGFADRPCRHQPAGRGTSLHPAAERHPVRAGLPRLSRQRIRQAVGRRVPDRDRAASIFVRAQAAGAVALSAEPSAVLHARHAAGRNRGGARSVPLSRPVAGRSRYRVRLCGIAAIGPGRRPRDRPLPGKDRSAAMARRNGAGRKPERRLHLGQPVPAAFRGRGQRLSGHRAGQSADPSADRAQARPSRRFHDGDAGVSHPAPCLPRGPHHAGLRLVEPAGGRKTSACSTG